MDATFDSVWHHQGMVVIAALLLVTAKIQERDPYTLPINRASLTDINPGLTDLKTGKSATAGDVALAAHDVRYVLIGESHTNPEHHLFQAEVIEALVKKGRRVIVGFEMFTREVADELDPWTSGLWTEERFIEQSRWKSQWGFDYALYRPIFEAIRQNKLPMAALNISRDLVRTVGKAGVEGLSMAQMKQIPNLYLGNQDHRMIFDALMGGHPPMGYQGEHIYAAQVLWDEAMADSAIQAMEKRGQSPKAILVVIAGSGHVMYGQGIGWRVARRTGARALTVVCIDGETPRKVSKSLGDFVYLKGKD